MKKISIFDRVSPGDIVEFYQRDGTLFTRELILSYPDKHGEYTAFMLYHHFNNDLKIRYFKEFFDENYFIKLTK